MTRLAQLKSVRIGLFPATDRGREAMALHAEEMKKVYKIIGEHMQDSNPNDVDAQFEQAAKATEQMPAPTSAAEPAPPEAQPPGQQPATPVVNQQARLDAILPQADTERIRDQIMKEHPKFWDRLMEEIQIATQGHVDRVAQQFQAGFQQREGLLAAIVVMNKAPVTIDRLALSDANGGSLAFGKNHRGETVIAFVPRADEKPKIVLSADQRILKMQPPGKRR